MPMEWLANVRQVTPYVPGEQPRIPNLIKLNTNENPYPPAPGVERALDGLDKDRLRLYPDPSCELLVNACAKAYHLDPEQVFVGVGSDDVLAMSFMTFFHSGQPVWFPDITYSFYRVWAQLLHIPFEEKPLDEAFHLKKQDYMGKNGGIVIANPNAPTGEYLPVSDIEEIVKNNPSSVVIVDEAYIDFGGASALGLIERYDNVLVVQTMSKSRSLAGMRIGMAFGCRELIRALSDVKFAFNSYTMNMPALAAGAAALEDTAWFDRTRNMVIATRERSKGELRRLGFVFGDSQTNFIFASHPQVSAEVLFRRLRENGILVRHFNQERIRDYLRITIGTDEQMDRLFQVLEKLLKEETVVKEEKA